MTARGAHDATRPDARGTADDARRALPVDDARFAAPVCRNCDAALTTPYCAQCGQKKAARLGLRDLGRETWERWRLFELGPLRTVWRLLSAPGRVAREYVLGMRVRHVHPLKLLLVVIALLVLVLARANYLESQRFHEVNAVMKLIAEYGKWSFSLNIVAVLVASLLVFPRRLAYRPVEHLVLATYVHSVVVLLIVVNLLPTLFGAGPEFVQAHKAASAYYVPLAKGVIVAIAFAQFFVLDLRREGWKLLAAVVVYIAANWWLLRLYARAVLWWVTGHH